MKNIHVIPTSSPSRLFIAENDIEMFILSDKYELGNKLCQNQNIFITNDEEIKEENLTKSIYVIDIQNGNIGKLTCKNSFFKDSSKLIEIEWSNKQNIWNYYHIREIILTTDQNLIKDGVQAINDTFLEWFCKNPSCEFIEVGTYAKKIRAEFDANGYREMDVFGKDYRITIPQEEPKQETLEEIETIGDFIKKESKSGNESVGIVKGAKWQAERMYSEEDLREAFRQGQDNMDYSEIYGWDSKLTEQEWFEQFKKK
jgi:hypothetical protein